MKKSYTIAGVGVCLGKKVGFEALVESVITGVQIAGKELADSLDLAVREALGFTPEQRLPVLTDSEVDVLRLRELKLGALTVCGNFREMLEAAPEQALLLSKRDHGWLAIALTQEDVGFAQVEIRDGEETAGDDDFLNFLLSALEVRYALHLDDRDTPYRFWDAQGARSKVLSCSGAVCTFTEPEKPTKRVYRTKKYLLPVVFTTVAEAKRKLTALKEEASLASATETLLSGLSARNEKTNTIVLLAENRESLAAEIDELLKHSDRLLKAGFSWKSRSGSRYVCRICAKPQIVFMNPPASMFNSKAFYHFFFTIYGTLEEISRFETDKLLTGDKKLFLSDYLFDIVVNYCVTTLLERIGIRPDIMSGASMGEMAILLNHLRNADGTACAVGEVLSYIEAALRFMARSDDAPSECASWA